MTATDEALKQLDALLGEYNDIAPLLSRPGWRDLPVDHKVLTNRLQGAIERLTMPSSAYARAVTQQQQQNKGFGSLLLTELASIAAALREDIRAGWLMSVVELAHADTYAGYLEMAEGLVSRGYKDPAAVIAGTSLEVHLKALATKYGAGLQLPNGAPKKMDAVNAELKTAGVYGGIEQKQVTTWLDLRNRAAHGEYGKYDDSMVKAMVEGVGNFAVRHPA